MRIAVCLSGQLRQWEMGVENQKWFWTTANKEHVQVDYFAHTWTYSWDRPGVSQEYERRQVAQQELDSFKVRYDLKGLSVDSRDQHLFRGNDHWSSLFYSFAKSLELKRDYEIENNFIYDIVVKSRPDILFHPSKTFKVPHLENNVIHSSHGGIMALEYHMYNVNDILFLSNSFSMDLLSNLYFYRQEGIEDFNIYNKKNIHVMGPGTLMHEYFRDFGITPYFGTAPPCILLKEGCPQDLDLFVPDEFDIMTKYWQDWYTK